jgi:hypothetical protein
LLVEATHIILPVMQLSAVNFAVRCAAICCNNSPKR